MAANRHDRRRRAAIARKQKGQHRARIEAHGQAKRIAFTCPLNIHAAVNAGERRRFDMVAYTGQPLHLDEYPLPVVINVATVDYSAQEVPALHQHEQNVKAAVGQIDTIQPAAFDGKPGIAASGYFTPTDELDDVARKVMKKHDAGQKFQASVGGNHAKLSRLEAGQKAFLNDREYVGPLLIADGFRFKEISVVMCGADEFTSVSAKASKPKIKGAAMEFSTWVTAKGFEEGKLTETQAANLKQMFAAEFPETPEEEKPEDEMAAAEGEEEEEETPPPPAASARKPKIRATGSAQQLRDEAAEELTRQKEIKTYIAASGVTEITITADGKKQKVDFLAHAIKAGWDKGKCAVAALEEIRMRPPPPPPFGHINSHEKSATIQALSGAMILRAGGKLDHPAYKTRQGFAMLRNVAPWLLQDINASDRQRYMEAAHKYDHYSMIEICAEACRLNRIDTGGMGRDEMIRAAFSGGGNLTNIFTTNVNAILLATYAEFPNDTTAGWCSEVDVNDFKTNERPRVNVGDGLKKLPRGSEAEHATYTDSVESYKIARYAKQFVIDEQDAIDDNFGVFRDVPTGFGNAAARLKPDLVYGAVILANPTLTATSVAVFSNSNSPDNNLSGTLSYASLSAAFAQLALVRENSVNLNLQATHILVPPTLRDLAMELLTSTGILYGADDETRVGDKNVLNSYGVQVMSEPRLENGVTNPADETSQSGSSSAWYAVAGAGHTIEIGYLKGTGRAPQVRSFVLDQGKWGMGWDVKHDIGVKALDFKSMNKSS